MNVVYSNFVRSWIQLFFDTWRSFGRTDLTPRLRCLKIGLPFVKETTFVTLFLKPSVNFSNWISSTSRADIRTVTYSREFSWPAQNGWEILPFATTVCGIHIDALRYLSPYHSNDLSTGRHLLRVSFVINPKKNFMFMVPYVASLY